MEERVNILTPKGIYTGESCTKEEAHANGYFHPTIHVWFYTENDELLIQKRQANKINYPCFWDVSVAGHIIENESIIDAAIRETQEELGLSITASDLQKVTIYKSEVTHQNNYIDNEFNYVFICLLNKPVDKLLLQNEEVAAVRLITITDFKNRINSQSIHFVPYQTEYFEKLFSKLAKR